MSPGMCPENGAAETMRWSCLPASYFGLCIYVCLLTSYGCQVTRYREVVFTVSGQHKGNPLPKAYIQVFAPGQLGEMERRDIPISPSGYTDENGKWIATVPTNRSGGVLITCRGYEDTIVSIDECSFENGVFDVILEASATKAGSSTQFDDRGSSDRP